MFDHQGSKTLGNDNLIPEARPFAYRTSQLNPEGWEKFVKLCRRYKAAGGNPDKTDSKENPDDNVNA